MLSLISYSYEINCWILLHTFSEFVESHLDVGEVSSAHLALESVQSHSLAQAGLLLPLVVMVQAVHTLLVNCNQSSTNQSIII